jgi:isocitrate/isopropylmalate dehydrogenase
MTTKRVALIEGEDAAPEAVRPTVALIDKLDPGIDWIRPPVGEEGMKLHGSPFPDQARQAIDESDATLFGAASSKSLPALVYLRWGKETYANVRPARWIPGYKSPMARPQEVDFVIVRENLEDLYMGVEGEVEDLKAADLTSMFTQKKVADMGPARFALKVITEKGTEGIARFAFEIARKRKAAGRPGKVTCAAKHNMLFRSDGLFKEVTQRVAGSYPDIEFETYIVDDFAHRLVARPHDFDVVVMPNLYGDILSDAGGSLIGGLGLAPSGCYGRSYAYFEPAHGTAPDLAGKNQINPTATILSAVMMLQYLGFAQEAERITIALEKTYADGRYLTPDQGGAASTTEFADAMAAYL